MQLRSFHSFILLFFLTNTHILAQTEVDTIPQFDYDERQLFEIGQITVSGTDQTSAQTIIATSGLAIGDKLTIPGDVIPFAIKSIMSLQLFDDVEISQTQRVDNIIFLEIKVIESSVLASFEFKGINKKDEKNLHPQLSNILIERSIVSNNHKQNCLALIEDYFQQKGFLNVTCQIKEMIQVSNEINLVFEIIPGEKVKINAINFSGNTVISDRQLLKCMTLTRKKNAILKKSKFISEDFETDKQNILAKYQEQGYRDARIIKDAIEFDQDGNLNIEIEIEEGKQYFFGNIYWKGNTIYSDTLLTQILQINYGDVYNADKLNRRLLQSFDGSDIAGLYLDWGYLYFQAESSERSLNGQYIDLEIRIFEGKKATINQVSIVGNDLTDEDVIRRELRTKPGNTFSRADIIRSQRELVSLGYFEPEAMDVKIEPNPQDGTVDITYELKEKRGDRIELALQYAGLTRLSGSVGLTMNNFSLKNITKPSKWAPLPYGHGQSLSLRAQSNGNDFSAYNFSFTEPWLGGKKPNTLSLGAGYSKIDQASLGLGYFRNLNAFVSFGSRLNWPDDYFSYNTSISIEDIEMRNYARGQFSANGENIDTGKFKNISIEQSLTRSTIINPFLPRRGSRVSLSLKFTPPYSLFRKNNTEFNELETAEKFRFLEYHKWGFDGEWYAPIGDKFVFAARAKLGFLGTYNAQLGLSLFERFEIGGDGLNNQLNGIAGKDIISLRGYDVEDFEQNLLNNGGAGLFSKYTMELRYLLSENPSLPIYAHGFVQAANSWSSFRDFNPFELKRAAGFGMRAQLPYLGLIGFDMGYGFDKEPQNRGWQFNLIFGFEPW